MIKYYEFISLNNIDSSYLSEAINESYDKVTLVFLNKKSGYIISDEGFIDSLSHLLPILSNDIGLSIKVVVCHTHDNLAIEALEYANKHLTDGIYSLADIILDAAIKNDYSLKPYIDYEFKDLNRELLITAETFLKVGLNSSLASKVLYIHRNTFLYRLNAFIDKTNLDIRDYQNANFFLAYLKLYAKHDN